MSLLNQNNGKKKGAKKAKTNTNQPGGGSKFIAKPGKAAGFTSKQSNTGAQRGS